MPTRPPSVPPPSQSSSFVARQQQQQKRSGGIAAFLRQQQHKTRASSAEEQVAHYDRGLDSDHESEDEDSYGLSGSQSGGGAAGNGTGSNGQGSRRAGKNALDGDEEDDQHAEEQYADSEEEEHQWLEDEEQSQQAQVADELTRPIAHLRLLGTGSSSRVPPLPHRPDKAYDVEVHSDEQEDNEDEAEDSDEAEGQRSPGADSHLPSVTGSNLTRSQSNYNPSASASGRPAPPPTPSAGGFYAPSSASSSSALDEQDDADRVAWQDMLSNVLEGDVLKSEKDRLSGSLAHQLDDSAGRAKYQAGQIWLGVRAAVRQRNIEAEQRFLQEARAQIPGILNEVIGFRIKQHTTLEEASSQINALLSRIDWVASLFPSFKALRISEPSFDADTMLDRIDTLQSWITITNRLHLQLNILQRWTGSESLEITQPKNEVIDPVPKHPEQSSSTHLPSKEEAARNPRILDTSNFIERMLKEESFTALFGKRIICDIFPLLKDAKTTTVENSARFQSMGLPTFEDEFVALVNFPMRLMREALRLRLDSGSKVNKDDPNIVLINQLTDDFRSGLEMATEMKRAYLDIVIDGEQPIDAPHAAPTSSPSAAAAHHAAHANGDHHWYLPPPQQEDSLDNFDVVLQDSLKFFFRLLHWKLRSKDRTIYLKETDIIETEWEFLSKAVDQIDGGDLLVAEHFSMLTNKLIQRVVSYVNESMDVLAKRKMDALTTARWFNQTLDNVRVRHRKLLRFGKALVQRFENSCEFFLGSADVKIDLGRFITALADSGHFLIYTRTSEQNGLYMVGSPTLEDRPDLIRRMLTRCFSRSTQPDAAPDDLDAEGPFDVVRYVLILAPRDPFIWTGNILNISLTQNDLDMRDRRVRIVAEGPEGRLGMAKKLFLTLFPAFRGLVVSDKQAHFARVNRDIKKIKLANSKLCEAVVSAPKDVARVTQGNEALVAPYYAFAADIGQRSLRSFESKYKIRLIPELQKFAIHWTHFIAEDCTPSEGRTFKWAVSALEFIRLVTKGEYIFRLDPEDFANMRSGVASCMTLLISHFDILGARGAVETRKAKEKADAETQEARRLIQDKLESLRAQTAQRDGLFTAEEEKILDENKAVDGSIRPVQKKWLYELHALDHERYMIAYNMGMAGRVLDTGQGEGSELLSLASSSANITIKWQQGRYIGSGTYGTVYLAVNLENGSLMAVKEIRFQDSASAGQLINQVQDEMRVMSMLHHPNIVEYIGIEVHRDKVYIFEEYCQAGSLASLLTSGPLDEAVLQIYTYQLVDGLTYLHGQGVVHRDIKPDNILVDQHGAMKLADFGSAKVLAKKSATLARTRKGGNPTVGPQAQDTLNGTPMYMSPEVIKGENTGKHGAPDVWSLGCVVLEAATGKRPWAGLDNEWAIMFHIGIAKEHPPLPDESQMSLEGIDFIRQCLTIDASQRPAAEDLFAHPWFETFERNNFYTDEDGSISLSSGGTSDLLPDSDSDAMRSQGHSLGAGASLSAQQGLSEISESGEDQSGELDQSTIDESMG